MVIHSHGTHWMGRQVEPRAGTLRSSNVRRGCLVDILRFTNDVFARIYNMYGLFCSFVGAKCASFVS